LRGSGRLLQKCIVHLFCSAASLAEQGGSAHQELASWRYRAAKTQKPAQNRNFMPDAAILLEKRPLTPIAWKVKKTLQGRSSVVNKTLILWR
jgi:hypothetical protein